jgi:multimeric flavodoxin WrbA
MRILVINGSPKGNGSDTLKLTKAFLQGMGIVTNLKPNTY